MTDIIKLIDDVIDYNASDERPRAALQSAIEALQGDIGSITSANMWLQGEVERMMKEHDELNAIIQRKINLNNTLGQQFADAISERDALAAELAGLKVAPKALAPEPLIKFRHGCKWCGKAKCAAGCHGIGGTP